MAGGAGTGGMVADVAGMAAAGTVIIRLEASNGKRATFLLAARWQND
jgi:hypothetical protein